MMATGNQRTNRLAGAVSPYLESHSHQEVDWYPWGDEAFAEAQRRDVPILISIGYRTCHWCHVMSRESFDDPDVAQLLNDSVVAIKVDREEHGDVDATYLAQAAAFTGQLGWPLNVFATPQGHAFYAATYLPPESRDGLPSFSQAIRAVSQAWRENREDVLHSSAGLVEALGQARSVIASETHPVPSATDLDNVVLHIAGQEDPGSGGFGHAPKFPLAPVLNFLISYDQLAPGTSRELVHRTLALYVNTDIYDPVEGGFFRYSTNADFSDPHYERMLVDNAGLLLAYSRTGDRETAGSLVSFLRDHLFVGTGFASGQDSESTIAGHSSEGGYYLLDAAGRAGLQPPALDSKIVTGWNGLALEGLAAAHRAGVLGNPGQLAEQIARWLWGNHVDANGSLVRLSREGIPSSAPATLEDYGGFALGLLELGCAVGKAVYIQQAATLLTRAMEGDYEGVDPVLVAQGLATPGQSPGDISEGASPSGASLMALALLKLSHLTSSPQLREIALSFVSPYLSHALEQPLGMGGVLRFVTEFLAPERELVVVGDQGGELSDMARSWNPAGALSLVVTPDQAAEFLKIGCTIMEGRLEASTPTAYLCERGTCALPVTELAALRAQLTQ
jgi:hypothetical protein